MRGTQRRIGLTAIVGSVTRLQLSAVLTTTQFRLPLSTKVNTRSARKVLADFYARSARNQPKNTGLFEAKQANISGETVDHPGRLRHRI